MTSLLTDVMYRCQLPHRPQQRVGNPLQQVVFRLLALNLPAKANAAVSEPTTGRHNAASADNVTATHPHGDLRADRIGRNPARLDDSHQPDAVRRGKQTRMNKGSTPANPLLWLVVGMAPRAGVAPGHRITQSAKPDTQKPPPPLGEGWGEGETEMQNPTSPVPTTPQRPRHDCYIDQHGNCPAADTELCDLHCPYRDEN